MKRIKLIGLAAFLVASMTQTLLAQVGRPGIHDPSTPVEDNGKYYTFGTGAGALMSEDGWKWVPGGFRPGNGAAPDALKIGDRYLVTYGHTGGGGDHKGVIYTMWNKTMDTKSPDFKYSEEVVVASSDGYEENDAIDPALFLDPTTGRLWLTYGTYFGYIRMVELDPKTGKRVAGNKPVNVAIVCEASYMMYHDGWYYLLGTHGTCCAGANSTYNVVVGRSKSVTGPFIDNVGRSMLEGGGKMVATTRGRLIGPGHFGRVVVEPGVEKMSIHWEADLDQGGISVLGLLPVVWKNGWPLMGENIKTGTYEIQSERRGFGLELAVDPTNAQGGGGFGGGGFGGGGGRGNAAPAKPVPFQQVADVSKNWPTGDITTRIGDYIARPHQKWTITPAPDSSGYFGAPYYKITIAGTERALAASTSGRVITVPAYTGAPEQLWKLDQLTDGTYRMSPKAIPDSKEKLALISAGDSTPALGKFVLESDNSKWSFVPELK